MTNKTKTILCVCALTASAFVWNATAEGETTGNVNYNNENHGGAWYLYNPGPTSKKQTVFQAVANNVALSFEIERIDPDNSFKNGFIFGTYTVSNGNIIRDTLGTVDGTLDENEKILIKPVGSKEYVGSVPSSTFNANDIVGVWVQEIASIDPETDVITYKDLVYYSDNNLTIDQGANSQVVDGYVMHDTPGPKTSNYYTEEEYDELAKAYRDKYIEDHPEDVAAAANPESIAVPYATFTHMQFTEGYLEGGDLGANGVASLWFDDAIVERNYSIDYGYVGQDWAPIEIHVQGVFLASGGDEGGQVSNGHPLPGVWATIALAGAASAYLKRRRKENK